MRAAGNGGGGGGVFLVPPPTPGSRRHAKNAICHVSFPFLSFLFSSPSILFLRADVRGKRKRKD